MLSQWRWRSAAVAIGVVLLRVVAPLHVWALRGTSEVPLAKVHLDAVNEATLHQALREPSFWLPDASLTFFLPPQPCGRL